MRFKEFKNVNENMGNIFNAIMGKAGIDITAGTSPDKDMSSQASNIGSFNTKPSAGNNPSAGDSMLPVKGKISSPFGMRQRGMHSGTDFAVPIGTPVLAPDDGVVWMAGSNGSAGIMVAINSGNTQHKLMHLSQIKVKPGEKVKKGQVVGLSGNTGLSTGPHVHWEKHVAGRATDPMRNIG